MNTSVIRYLLGYILKLEGFLLLLPCIVAGIYYEKSGIYFLIVALISIAIGFIFSAKKPRDFTFYLKEGCATTALGWIVLSIFGCLPFYISGEIPSFTDALFETISGFTTTGASILPEVESLSYCMNFWRCFTHWIGGMGVLVFLLAIIPLSGGSNINLMRAESPGPSVGKLVPKMKHTARLLYIIYFGLTTMEIIFLLFGKMPLYDAICTSLGTAGTGGFGIKNDSFCGYNVYLQWVVTIFMILFGVNFNAYYLLLFGHIREALKVEEVRYYFGIIIASVVVISVNIAHMCTGVFDAVTKAAFQVGSIITTTGFSSTDFDRWPELSKTLLVLLMFIGASPASTGGGVKTTTFGVMLLLVLSVVRGRETVGLFGKQLAVSIVRRALTIVIISIGIVLACTMALSISEHGNGRSMLDLLYEAVSAFATVGLTSVGTASLNPVSQGLLVPIMFFGRVGPLTLALALASKLENNPKNRIHYPEEKIMIG